MLDRETVHLNAHLLLSLPRLAPGAARGLAGSCSRLRSHGGSVGPAARLGRGVAAEYARPQEVFDRLQAGQRLDEDDVGGVVPELGLVGRARHAQLEGLRQR